jgi:hypothetical protein
MCNPCANPLHTTDCTWSSPGRELNETDDEQVRWLCPSLSLDERTTSWSSRVCRSIGATGVPAGCPYESKMGPKAGMPRRSRPYTTSQVTVRFDTQMTASAPDST